ncbi:unnamed protein product [Effrenium voratum]|uniref:Laminin G domain-containing protein n=1 Tax=Effrenium voratum TaxID=2562239 RepID=A0AA36IMJ7_9DINO|nr:unnamed protein product [Effrenium voratum]
MSRPLRLLLGQLFMVLAFKFDLNHDGAKNKGPDGSSEEVMPHWHPECGSENLPQETIALIEVEELSTTQAGENPPPPAGFSDAVSIYEDEHILELKAAPALVQRSYRRRISRRREYSLCLEGFERDDYEEFVSKDLKPRARDKGVKDDPPGFKDIADYSSEGIGARMYEITLDQVVTSAFFEMMQWQSTSAQLWVKAACDSSDMKASLSCHEVSAELIDASSARQFTEDVLIDDCQLLWQTQPLTVMEAMKGMMDRPKFLETKLKQVKQNMWFRTLYPVGAKICAFCAYTSTCKATKWKEVHYQKVQGTPFPTRFRLDHEASKRRCLALPGCGFVACDRSLGNCELHLKESLDMLQPGGDRTLLIREDPDYSAVSAVSSSAEQDAEVFLQNMCPWFMDETLFIENGQATLPNPSCKVTREHEVLACSELQSLRKEACAAGLMFTANQRRDLAVSQMQQAHTRAISRRVSLFDRIMKIVNVVAVVVSVAISLVPGLQAVGAAAMGGLKALAVAGKFASMASKALSMASKVMKVVGKVGKLVSKVWNKVGPTLKKVAQKASQHLKKALKKLDKFKDYAENVQDWAKEKWETVKGHLEKVYQFGKETWEKYGAQFKAGNLSQLSSLIKNLTANISMDNVSQVAQSVMSETSGETSEESVAIQRDRYAEGQEIMHFGVHYWVYQKDITHYATRYTHSKYMECSWPGAWYRALEDFGAAPQPRYSKTWMISEDQLSGRRRRAKWVGRPADDQDRRYYEMSMSHHNKFLESGANSIFANYRSLRASCKEPGSMFAEDLVTKLFPSGSPEPLDEEHAADMVQVKQDLLSAGETATQAVCMQLEVRLCDAGTLAADRDVDQAAFLAQLEAEEREKQTAEIKDEIKAQAEALKKEIAESQAAVQQGIVEATASMEQAVDKSAEKTQELMAQKHGETRALVMEEGKDTRRAITKSTEEIRAAMGAMDRNLQSSISNLGNKVLQESQRSTAQVLGGIKQTREALSSKMTAITGQIQDLSGDVKVMKKEVTEAVKDTGDMLMNRIRRTEEQLKSDIQDVERQVVARTDLIMDQLEDGVESLSRQMQAFEDKMDSDLAKVQNQQAVMTDMLVANAMRMDELHEAMEGALDLAEEHQLEYLSMHLAQAMLGVKSAFSSAFDLAQNVERAKIAYGRAVSNYTWCQVPWPRVVEAKNQMTVAKALLTHEELLPIFKKARDAFVAVAEVLTKGRVLRRLMEKAVLEIQAAEVKKAARHICRDYLGPESLKAVGQVLKASVVKTLKAVTEQLDQAYNWLQWTQSICRPYGATLGKKSQEMIWGAWHSIVGEVAKVLRALELPTKDPSHELLLLYHKLLGRVLPELCPVPTSCTSAILSVSPGAVTTSLVTWDDIALPTGKLLVVVEQPQSLLLEDGVHSGWEIDIRKPMPATIEGVDSQLPQRVFGCLLDKSSNGYVAVRPQDAKAAALPDRGFCFCAGSVGADGNVSAACRHRGEACKEGSDVALDLWSPVRRALPLPDFDVWTERYKELRSGLCGDGKVDDWEACDDGNAQGGDGCGSDCRRISAGFTCEAGKPCFTTCGDGILAGQEDCDDGNVASGDGCSENCVLETFCTRKDPNLQVFRLTKKNHSVLSSQLQRSLEEPVMHAANAAGTLHAAVPVLTGSVSCAHFDCPAGCSAQPWPESILCGGDKCDNSDVSRCCLCESRGQRSVKGLGMEPCFSWQVDDSGSVPSVEEVVSACGGKRGYILAAIKDGKFLARHELLLPRGTFLKEALEQGGTFPVSSQLLSLSLKVKKLPGGGTRFGYYCAGSGADCQLWQVTLGANSSQLSREAMPFAASQRGGNRVREAQEGTVLAMYKVGDPSKWWDCKAESQEPRCGDGLVSGLEECELEKPGCSVTCEVEEGWTCGLHSCEPLCGDGVTQTGEVCDDGSNDQYGGCSNDCSFPTRRDYLAFHHGCEGPEDYAIKIQEMRRPDVTACRRLCTANEDCSAAEWRDDRGVGGCRHFVGRVPAAFGHDGQDTGAACLVKVKYALFAANIKSAKQARARCAAEGLEAFSLTNAAELKAASDFLSDVELQGDAGVPIAWGAGGAFYDLAGDPYKVDSILREAGYTDAEPGFVGFDQSYRLKHISVSSAVICEARHLLTTTTTSTTTTTTSTSTTSTSTTSTSTTSTSTSTSTLTTTAPLGFPTRSWFSAGSGKSGYLKLGGEASSAFKSLMSGDELSLELMFRLLEKPNIDHSIVMGTSVNPPMQGDVTFSVTVRSHHGELNVVFAGNNDYQHLMSHRGVCDGKWHHLVLLVRKSARKVFLYVDGQSVLTQSNLRTGIATATEYGTDLILGTGSKDCGRWCHGHPGYKQNAHFARLQFWKRALSGQELGPNLPSTCDKAGLVSAYPLNNDYRDAIGDNPDFVNAQGKFMSDIYDTTKVCL